MLFTSKSILVAALVVAPAIAVPVSHVHKSGKDVGHSLENAHGRDTRTRDNTELAARAGTDTSSPELMKRRRGGAPQPPPSRMRNFGHKTGQFLEHASNAASVIDVGRQIWSGINGQANPNAPREFFDANDELETRAGTDTPSPELELMKRQNRRHGGRAPRRAGPPRRAPPPPRAPPKAPAPSRLRNFGHKTGRFLEHASNAASVVDTAQQLWSTFRGQPGNPNGPRDYIFDEALDVRADAGPVPEWRVGIRPHTGRGGGRRAGRRGSRNYGNLGAVRGGVSGGRARSMSRNVGREYMSSLEELD
ncbi:hypothetical protein DFP72DRAFT_1069130 [Ephemerocybe angulata]|uniref:Uncharacterized protein n=1 Tax=Ephemerocybe angulata TaxID=980116 RepID=A0A8H6M5M4_9AGAR|nr:hypothetical protein DFP72DRAFT_1069130 [Tulosesus angulatus]